MSKAIILTGLRANNDLHIGNYIGALKPIVEIATDRNADHKINLFVPDLHSFTTAIDHSGLQAQISKNLQVYAAAGLPLDDPNIQIYRQSHIPAHSELTWILNCFTGFGEMGRMTQFKDKSSQISDDRISLGLFNYPVLMAADILLYNADYVPVGEDQSQHLEFARDIAQRLNRKFSQELFVIPKAVAEQQKFFKRSLSPRIKNLADPTKKMSKSDATGKGVIFLNDSPLSARKKIMSATTDNEALIKYDPATRSGISNLIDIFAQLSSVNTTEIENKYKNETSYGKFKSDLADVVCNFLEKFQLNLSKVDDKVINQKLVSSEKLMNAEANKTLLRVQQAVGLR